MLKSKNTLRIFWRLRCLKMGAPFGQWADFTLGHSGGADGPAMEHHPMTEVVRLLRREYRPQLLFYLDRIFCTVGEPQPSSNSDAVGIGNHHARGVKDIALDQIGGFAAYSGQSQQILHPGGNFPSIVAEQHPGTVDQIFAFAIKKATGMNVLCHLGGISLSEGLQGGEPLK